MPSLLTAVNCGEVIALSGPLGAGKTTFTQSLGRALGIKKEVKSPTFVVMHLHKTNRNLMLCHVDAYRMSDLTELDAIGLRDYLGNPRVITVIEWAEKIKEALPKNTLWLKFSFSKNKRAVTIK